VSKCAFAITASRSGFGIPFRFVLSSLASKEAFVLARKTRDEDEHLFQEVEAAVDPDELETQRKVGDQAKQKLGVDAVNELRATGANTPTHDLLPIEG